MKTRRRHLTTSPSPQNHYEKNYLINPYTHKYNVIGLVVGRTAPILINLVQNLFLLGHRFLVDFEQNLTQVLAHKLLTRLETELVLETVGESVEAVALLQLHIHTLERVEFRINADRHLAGLYHLHLAVADEHQRVVGSSLSR